MSKGTTENYHGVGWVKGLENPLDCLWTDSQEVQYASRRPPGSADSTNLDLTGPGNSRDTAIQNAHFGDENHDFQAHTKPSDGAQHKSVVQRKSLGVKRLHWYEQKNCSDTVNSTARGCQKKQKIVPIEEEPVKQTPSNGGNSIPINLGEGSLDGVGNARDTAVQNAHLGDENYECQDHTSPSDGAQHKCVVQGKSFCVKRLHDQQNCSDTVNSIARECQNKPKIVPIEDEPIKQTPPNGRKSLRIKLRDGSLDGVEEIVITHPLAEKFMLKVVHQDGAIILTPTTRNLLEVTETVNTDRTETPPVSQPHEEPSLSHNTTIGNLIAGSPDDSEYFQAQPDSHWHSENDNTHYYTPENESEDANIILKPVQNDDQLTSTEKQDVMGVMETVKRLCSKNCYPPTPGMIHNLEKFIQKYPLTRFIDTVDDRSRDQPGSKLFYKHSCLICFENRSFKAKNDLKKHYYSHFKRMYVKYRCDSCDFGDCRTDYFLNHMVKNHGCDKTYDISQNISHYSKVLN
jgi:hypothetical protein